MVSLETGLEESSRATVETPWDVINDITDGGLGIPELGVVVIHHIGKSWTLHNRVDVIRRIKQ